ncbi:hypothetical protein FC17_GL002294 [Secundilactobacillus paracollinoides DSM 15502 = JCM 11969]|nr:hypothetical protein FC17_GL002294 [Secundilactobacillus paracollinoides DSM 15502 = JCM 11969]
MACPSHLLTSGPKPIGQLTALLDLSKWQHFEDWLAPCKPAFFFLKKIWRFFILAITILMILYTLLTFFIGGFFLAHQHKPFLIFHPEANKPLSGVIKFGGYSLVILGVVAAAATISQNTVFICIALFIGVADIVGVQLMLVSFFPKAK